jgi:acyl-CoA reductase-like NAD-dependent aldehyde dehydrogenase
MALDLSGVPSGLPVGEGWVDDLPTAEVRFPYDGSVVATAPVGDVPTAQAALEAGLAAVRPTGALSAGVRRAVLVDVERELARRHDELVDLLIAESGKPRVDCEVELARTLFTWSAAAEAVGQVHGETMPIDLQASGEGMVGYWVRKPIGLVIGIAGFNYPLLLASHKIAPALAAGCPVICKPAPHTPLATLVLVDVVRRALAAHGAPAVAVQLVTGDAEVGRVLTSDPRIGAVSFTGSAGVGHQIARDAAPRKVLLELGSNAALVVDDDVDLDKAVDAVFRGGFYASGQACISIQRVVVLDAVRDAFLARLAERVPSLPTGDPRLPETRVAALIDERSTERVLAWIRSAEEEGAKVLTGGVLADGAIEPTVLVDPPEDSLVWCEEIFGPVVAVRSVPTLDEAFDVVNRSRYGLQAAVFTRSLSSAMTAIDRLEVGGVVVNEVPGFRSDIQPYGGVKDSGTGREGPRFAIEELTVTRTAVIRPH